MDESERPKGFQVRDRRRFTETGDVREDPDAERGEPEAPAPPVGERPPAAPPPAAEQPRVVVGAADRGEGPAEITLATFLMSLSTQALMCLGEIPNPLTGNPEPDLAAVRELIDIIAMLQEKTRGNLDAHETRLFENILFDLRMRFVEKSRK
jgi:Domain of unknown function (DUF1844)